MTGTGITWQEKLGSFNEQTYSLPIGVDGLVMVYNSRLIESQPLNWDDLLRSGYLFSFPAADPAGFVHPWTVPLSQGGQLTDENGVIQIQAEALAPVLEFYSQPAARPCCRRDCT